ncbi:hypothetical protein H2201_006675 [Coniosporium apollinis]|uniref:Carrier domain-containing protein n=1 Tax=Coniosporium apollinis TaxID=61459 RepID=A0ABQ9NLL5_9PEZI|nr:hypothetical protein H2201_006675 [Coniosporium apollinis]
MLSVIPSSVLLPQAPAGLFTKTSTAVHIEEIVTEPQTVDELMRSRVESDPDLPIVSYPSSGLNYVDYTPKQLDRFAFRVAKKYASRIPSRRDSTEKPTVVGLLGHSDLNYLVTLLALTKLGHTVLFLSTRISKEAYASLLQTTGSRHLIVGDAFFEVGAALQREMSLHVSGIATQETYEYPILDEVDTRMTTQLDSSRESTYIAWIIHSSGSTGLPKPIYQTQKAALNNYASNMNMRGFLTLPLFHAHGVSSLFRAVHSKKQIHLYNATLPMTKQYLMDIIQSHLFEIFYGVPYALKLLAESEEGIRLLSRFQVVMFGGSACPDSLGDKLVEGGVNLVSHYGTTETGQLMTSFRPAGDKAWDYVRPSAAVKPYLRFEERGPGMYELICLDGWPSKVTSNRPDGSYATKDLFTKHPTLEAYKYFARLDDTLVLNNGEKANPLPLEGAVRQNRLVAEAVVFGAGKSNLGLALIKSQECIGMSDNDILDEVFESVERVQSAMPAYARVSKDMVFMLDADTPFPRTDKGTVIRQAFYKKFKDEIEALYEEKMEGSLELSEPELCLFLRRALQDIMMDTPTLADDQDFFAFGMDSLQATRLRSVIVKNISTNGVKLPINVAFDYPCIGALAHYLHATRCGGSEARTVSKEQEMQNLIEEYGQFQQHIPQPRSAQGQCIVLTGVTGSLGAHIAAQLASRPDVNKLYCLVRASSFRNAHDRVIQSMQQRQVYETLPVPHREKILALPADLSKPDLGLETEVLHHVQSEVTSVIHSAWSVNFNLQLSSFVKDCIAGAKNLLNLCLQAHGPSPASFNFCSSVSTVANTAGTQVAESLAELSAAQKMGYAQSKMVTEHLCDLAAKQTGMAARVLRIGQIIGDTQHGIWNAKEAIPMMLQTAITTRALPALDENLCWLPVDVVAGTVVDIAMSEAPARVFNVVNPHTLHWTKELLPAIRDFGIEFSEVGKREWVQRLRSSNPDPVVNPPIRLVEFFAGKFDNDSKRKAMDWQTEAAVQWSETLRTTGELQLLSLMDGLKVATLNIPGAGESDSRQFVRKLKWMLITLVFPEVIAWIALEEFWMARESHKAMTQLGGQWTMVHGYFANMGGFVLESPGRDPLPLSAAALEVLVEEGLIDVPDITEGEIKDRSKIDIFARLFTVLQVSWMVVQCIARYPIGLSVTPLEFITALFIGISSFTYIFERAKPKDVSMPVIIRCSSRLDDDLIDRLSGKYKRVYGDKRADATNIKRIPFSATLTNNDGIPVPKYVTDLRYVIGFAAGFYNSAHFFVRRKLFTPEVWLAWNVSCEVLGAVSFVSMILLVSQKCLPQWFKVFAWVVMGILYSLSRIASSVLGVVCFWTSLPVAAYYEVNWTTFIPHF